ncbi:tyrosine-type recombinase/integrase [Acidiferrimicrobium sp. IK]|uniref:tyrosine-type recombinase/integrase n=1 Tax=Acidiferrimicrobium sp. IK TaxID=2871700 RepID=UPI0021CB56DE|nr:tyrosine-type recombinase/integrase [Acidiferrimicrobium sp. IK]MCU4184142.1 tyrosine-type recombinase/integrase [Acidiferrimicrobium sp. IK]
MITHASRDTSAGCGGGLPRVSLGSNCDQQRERCEQQREWRRCGSERQVGGAHVGRQWNTLRHAFITAALDAGVPLRDVQEAASHADPRTTMGYDRARVSLDRHATYIVSIYIAGAAR